jgi:cysteine synthase
MNAAHRFRFAAFTFAQRCNVPVFLQPAEDRAEFGSKAGAEIRKATSGNTGIGLAMVCAQKGYPLVITMAETFSVERRKLMRFLGAKAVLTPAALRGMGMVIKAAELAKTHGWFLTRQFENEANPDMHSRTTACEIIADFADERLDYWVTGYGTGGHPQGRRTCPSQRAPGDRDHCVRAAGCAVALEWSAAAAQL